MVINIEELMGQISTTYGISPQEGRDARKALSEIDGEFRLATLPEDHPVATILSHRSIYAYKWLIYFNDMLISLRPVLRYRKKLNGLKTDKNNAFNYLLEFETAYRLFNEYELEFDRPLNGTRKTPDIYAKNRKSGSVFIIDVTQIGFSQRRKKANEDYLWLSSFLMGMNDNFAINGRLKELLSEEDKSVVTEKFNELKTNRIDSISYHNNKLDLEIIPKNEITETGGIWFDIYKDAYLLSNVKKAITLKADTYANKCGRNQELIVIVYCTEAYNYIKNREKLIELVECILADYEKLTTVIICSYDFGFDIEKQDKMGIVNGHILSRTTREDRAGMWHWIISKDKGTEKLLYNTLIGSVTK